jgi:RNA polymerase sigma-70 factor (ECF subfamily)
MERMSVDQDRFEQVYADHGAAVLAYARRRTENHTAQDVVSEVFVVVWRRLPELPDDPLPWLYGIARRVLANQRRASRRRDALGQALADNASRNSHERNDDAIIEALESLRPKDREILMLTAWEGLSPSEAAVVLGTSANACRIRLHRARRSLEKALEQRQFFVHTIRPREAR